MPPAPPPIPLPTYLHLLSTSEPRLEYHDGHIRTLDPGGINHSLINVNTTCALGNRLKPTPHRLCPCSLRISIPATRRHLYPDLTVITAQPSLDPDDPSHHAVTNPLLIIEITSPATETYERTDKLTHYLQIPSLREYALICSTTQHVETHHRQSPATLGNTPPSN